MTRYIAEAIHDEKGGIGYGAKRGDQTGTEVLIRKDWVYYGGRTYIYCGPNMYHVRNIMIQAAVFIANCDLIGYSQPDRRSLYDWLDSNGWSLKQLKKLDFKCSVDCSEMVAICVNIGLGKKVMPASNWTGTEEYNLLKNGFKFTDHLRAGTIRLSHNSKLKHTGIIIGSKKTGNRYVKQWKLLAGRYLYDAPKKTKKKNPGNVIAWVPAGSVISHKHETTTKQVKVSVNGVTGWMWRNTGDQPALSVKSYE